MTSSPQGSRRVAGRRGRKTGARRPLDVRLVPTGEIIIRIGVETLKHAVSITSDVDDPEGEIIVTDAMLFGRELVSELNREDEQGTTRVHRLLDAAAREAANQGAEGVDWEAMEKRRHAQA